MGDATTRGELDRGGAVVRGEAVRLENRPGHRLAVSMAATIGPLDPYDPSQRRPSLSSTSGMVDTEGVTRDLGTALGI